jgi:hypothetical protein
VDHERLKTVQLRIAFVVVALLLGACTTVESGNSGDSGARSEMMAAALVELITENHTFGEGPPPFTEYLVQDRIDPSAGEPTASAERSTRDLSGAERAAIEGALSDYGRVRWIEDPNEWRTSDLRPTVEGAVILGVGEPVIQDDTALVPVSLWCGGTCGTWFTYRLELVDNSWVVTGIEGPIAVS